MLYLADSRTVESISGVGQVLVIGGRKREIHDAIKRRCLYHWVDYPDAERELAIVRRKRPRAALHAGAARPVEQPIVAADGLYERH